MGDGLVEGASEGIGRMRTYIGTASACIESVAACPGKGMAKGRQRGARNRWDGTGITRENLGVSTRTSSPATQVSKS
jgi:hypothetical protein